MTDIVDRLRAVAALADFDADAVVIRNGADEIVSLREAIRRLADQDATLTDEELAALEWFEEVRKPLNSFDDGEYVATLRKLLERTK